MTDVSWWNTSRRKSASVAVKRLSRVKPRKRFADLSMTRGPPELFRWRSSHWREGIAAENGMERFSAIGLAILMATSGLAASKSPLADAAEKSDRATIHTLLKQHIDVNASQADGMTTLHWAAYRDDLEIAKLLA